MKSDYYYKLGSFFIILYDESIKYTYIMEISDTIFLSFQWLRNSGTEFYTYKINL